MSTWREFLIWMPVAIMQAFNSDNESICCIRGVSDRKWVIIYFLKLTQRLRLVLVLHWDVKMSQFSFKDFMMSRDWCIVTLTDTKMRERPCRALFL